MNCSIKKTNGNFVCDGVLDPRRKYRHVSVYYIMSSMQDQNNDVIHQCTDCVYSSCRKKRVERHYRDVHQKQRKICECGASITTSVFSRHKKESCPLQGKNLNKKKKRKMTEQPANELDVQNGKIEINYRMEKSADGVLVFSHDEIIINGIRMSLVPHELTNNENCEGKFINDHHTFVYLHIVIVQLASHRNACY